MRAFLVRTFLVAPLARSKTSKMNGTHKYFLLQKKHKYGERFTHTENFDAFLAQSALYTHTVLQKLLLLAIVTLLRNNLLSYISKGTVAIVQTYCR